MLDDVFDLASGMMTLGMIWSLLKETLCLKMVIIIIIDIIDIIIIIIILVVVIVMLLVQHAHVDSQITLSTFNQ